MRTDNAIEIMAISEPNQVDEPKLTCIIRDLTVHSQGSPPYRTVTLPQSFTVRQLMECIQKEYGYQIDSYKLLYEPNNSQTVEVEDKFCKLCSIPEFPVSNKKLKFQITEKDDGVPPLKEQKTSSSSNGLIPFDEMKTTDVESKSIAKSIGFADNIPYNNDRYITPSTSYDTLSSTDTGFCGLVNQAMTCYLNSLLQTLFMTPEFRNAIFSWEFNSQTSKFKEEKCIPYQLQRLFLHMQSRKQKAVETTSVTTSFGWDSTYSWQQHDVQELCRVMFDALEINWKDTSQHDLINQLYQGKLKDYVKCLECKNESARTDAYLDIPLVIKPFGSLHSFSSVEKALQAFIDPEILTGNNQYQCDNCGKKCDAHKGLKFVSFPYLLTLQLKRFDFDYSTMHRIKLNDRMTFPAILDLNNLLDDNTMPDTPVLHPGAGGTHFDELSSDSNGYFDSYSNPAEDYLDLDLTDKDVVSQLLNEKGEHIYELFSIMIHSGSAVGGHYYAYIKCMSTGEWYSFNDQLVSRITKEDIKRVYGGSGNRGLLSSTYSSSTNAYMLMYRKLDPERNADFISEQEFPQHLRELLAHMNSESEASRKAKEMERSMCRIRTYCLIPGTKKPRHETLEVHKDLSLQEATQQAFRLFSLDELVRMDCVRLVKYDEYNDVIDKSFDPSDERGIGDILGGVKTTYMFELLLEVKQPEEEWQVYKPGGISLKVLAVDLSSGMVKDPENIRVNQDHTVYDLKAIVAKTLKISSTEHMRCALEKYGVPVYLLGSDSTPLRTEGIYKGSKVYVEVGVPPFDDNTIPFQESRLCKIIELYQNTIRLLITLPTQMEIDKFKQRENSRQKLFVNETNEESADDSDVLYSSPAKGSGDGHDTTYRRPDFVRHKPINLGEETTLLHEEKEWNCSSMNDLNNSDVDDGLPLGASADVENDEEGSTWKSKFDDMLPPLEPTESGSSLDKNDLYTSRTQGFENEGVQKIDQLFCTLHANDSILTASANQNENPNKQIEPWGTNFSSSADDQATQHVDHSTENKVAEPSDSSSENFNDKREDKLDVQTELDFGLTRNSIETLSQSIELSTISKEYFLSEEIDDGADGQKNALKVQLDKRANVGKLKKLLQMRLGIPLNYFKMFRVFSNNQEIECSNSDTLTTITDNTRMTVRLSKVLGKGEFNVKIYELRLNATSPNDAAVYLFDVVLVGGMLISQVRRYISEELRNECNREVNPERIRLRKKSWKNPGVIFLDHQKIQEDIIMYSHWEMYIQVLEEPEPMKSFHDMCLFVQMWKPSVYEFGPMFELILPSTSGLNTVFRKIAEKTGLHEDKLEVAKNKGEFPGSISVLDVHTELDWSSLPKENEFSHVFLDTGCMVLYRDKDEPLGKLTAEKRKEITLRENTIYGKTSNASYGRKESALKIFMDEPAAPTSISKLRDHAIPASRIGQAEELD